MCRYGKLLFNRRPPRGETAAPLLFSAILSKRLSENAVHSKKAQCERQLCLGFIRRVLGGFLESSWHVHGRFRSRSWKDFSETCRRPKRDDKRYQKAPKGKPKAAKEEATLLHSLYRVAMVMVSAHASSFVVYSYW